LRHSAVLRRAFGAARFDVLVPWGAIDGERYIDVVTRSEGQERIDAIIARLRAGGDQ
jgi:hypothetical protein